MPKPNQSRVLTLTAAFLAASGCARTDRAATSPAAPKPTAECNLNTPAVPAPGPAAASAPAITPVALPVPHDAPPPAIHNVYRLGPSPNIISGGVPEGDAGFDELLTMGVKTIISVDGATPDIARAEARGLRYIHIPITYAEVSDDERVEIARAIRDFESSGPIFIHCHHGKHRSPAATAAAAVALGRITPQQGVAFMKIAGTAASYTGLYACVETSAPLSKATFDAAPADFPAVRRPEGMVAAMIEVDLAYENLGEIRAAGWTTPKDHPDLVPAAEAGRLTDQLRFSGEDAKSKALGDDYARKLRYAIEIAGKLEEDLVRGAPRDQLDAGYKLVQASCKDCHAAYRDRK